MNLENLFLPLFFAVLIDALIGAAKKSPPYMLGPFIRLWKQTAFLSRIINHEDFSRWRMGANHYVALKAIKAQSDKREPPYPVLRLLRASVRRNEPVVLLGEPGSGKTTAIEALTYQIAQDAYRYNLLLWLILLAFPLLLLKLSPVLSLIWLVSFALWEFLVCRAIIPVFIEARSDYTGGNLEQWYNELLKNDLGGYPLFASSYHTVFFVDGVNEVQATFYELFVEGWRSLIKSQKQKRVIFTSRTGEDPSLRLGIGSVLTIRPLDDDGVQEFLRVYGLEKARKWKKPFNLSQVKHDYDELQNRNLLLEDGIGRNPYWLRMMVLMESGFYTRNRGSLFRNFTEQLLIREVSAKPEGRKRKLEWTNIVPLQTEMELLGSLALMMHEEDRIGLTGEDGWRKACEVVRSGIIYGSLRNEDVFFEGEAATLLRVQVNERVEFVHHLVQEFFAAFALRHEPKWQRIVSRTEEIRWWETLFLLGGILAAQDSFENYSKFVRQILESNSGERSLFVAIGLLQSSENLPQDIVDAVIERFVSQTGNSLTVEQQKAIDGLRQILGEETAEAFARLCQKPVLQTKIKGAELLCALGGNRSIEILIALLASEDEPTANKIFTSIGVPAVWPLSKALSSDDYELQRRASDILKQIDVAGVAELVRGLRSEMADVRVRAAIALGKIGDPQAFDFLRNALGDTNVGVRAGVAFALGQIRKPDALKYLIPALSDPEWIVRWAAAYALGNIPDAQSVDSLLIALDDPDIDVQARIIETLGQIGDPRAMNPLLHATGDLDPEIRSRAIEALGRLKILAAFDYLAQALSDKDGDVRVVAAKGLGILNDSRGIELLIATLRDPDDAVKEAAAEALGDLGDSRAIPELSILAEGTGFKADVAWQAVLKIQKRVQDH